MSLLHLTKEIVGGGGTSGIMYNLFPKVTIIARGRDSYIACRFHKYGWPNNTSETSIGEISGMRNKMLLMIKEMNSLLYLPSLLHLHPTLWMSG